MTSTLTRKKSNRGRGPRIKSQTKDEEPHPHPDPDAVARALREARRVLGGEHFPSIPDGLMNDYIPFGRLNEIIDEIKKDIPEIDGDAELELAVREALLKVCCQQFITAFYDTSRAAFAIFGSSPEVIERTLTSEKMDIDDLYKTLGQAVALRIQCDVLRRKFGLAASWPVEDAILRGPGSVSAPVVEQLPRKQTKEPLAMRAGRMLFGHVPIPLDDPRFLQASRDAAHALIEDSFMKNRDSWRSRGPAYLKLEDRSFTQFSDPELAVYTAIQQELPEELRQPLPASVTPRRVMIQRFQDARKRNRNRIQETPGILKVKVNRRRRAKDG